MKGVGRHTLIFILGFLIGIGGILAIAPLAEAQTLSPEEKARLQAEYDQLQQEIAQWQKVLDDTRAKKNTIQGDVSALDAQIKKAETEIKQRNNSITTLGSEIQEKTKHIATLENKLDAGHESLAKLLRQKNETEKLPLALIAFSAEDLSEFFADASAIDAINRELDAKFREIRETREETQKERDVLDEKKNAELDAKHDVEVKKTAIKANQDEKKELLAVTKQQESAYSQVLADRQKRAQEIRTALFDLRDSQGITFESALNYATKAEQKTGVRAAMILAILSQESDLGKNIGSCYVKDLSTGDGVGKNTGTAFEKVMKAPRDTDPFSALASALGFDWSTTPVSCPLGQKYSASRGYGGAMGPSQFIPSTWQLYTPRLSAALGVGTPNPWNPGDAVMATALYLSDLGASTQTYTAERNAACKYYSGRSCDTRTPRNYTYGDSVVAKAQTFQNNIDFLNNL
jgi:membrane-bound lytic murein transglycosylase B